MKRAIHIFPTPAELADIEAVRASYDPLAGKVAPHVTLIFPFNIPLSEDDLAAHVVGVIGGIEPFEMTLGSAESTEPGVVWLPVVKGRTQVVQLHDRLYTGALSRLLSPIHVYAPHVTVGHVSADKTADALCAAQSLKVISAVWVDRVVIERIASDDMSEIENTMMLKGN